MNIYLTVYNVPIAVGVIFVAFIILILILIFFFVKRHNIKEKEGNKLEEDINKIGK